MEVSYQLDSEPGEHLKSVATGVSPRTTTSSIRGRGLHASVLANEERRCR